MTLYIFPSSLFLLSQTFKYLGARYFPLSGFHGILSGFLVGIKQIIPDQEFPALKLKAKVWALSLHILQWNFGKLRICLSTPLTVLPIISSGFHLSICCYQPPYASLHQRRQQFFRPCTLVHTWAGFTSDIGRRNQKQNSRVTQVMILHSQLSSLNFYGKLMLLWFTFFF